MTHKINHSRRLLLRRLAIATALVPALALPNEAFAAGASPPLSESDPEAKKLKYVTDAKRAQGAQTGNTCANCALYQGPNGSTEGPCQLFPGKLVMAAGWCSSWAGQM